MNIRSFLSLAAVALVASCDRDTKMFSTADLGAERSTIAGVVTGVGDSGVSGIVVTAQAVDEKGAALKDVPANTSLSGLGGRFSMELRPGFRWKVSWQSPDYKTPGNGTVVDLGLRQVVDLGEPTRLTYRYGWIVGITTPGATVAVDGQDATTKANDKGLFRLERVVPGRLEVISIVPGKGYGRVADSLAAEKTDSVIVTTARPLSSVEGVLTSQDGTVQAGAVVSALGGIVRDTTDALGRFHLDNLPARSKVQILVDRGLDLRDRIVLPTPGEDSTWSLGNLPVPGTVSGPGVRLSGGVVVADSGEILAIPLLWDLLDSTRTVLGFAWDTTGKSLRSRAVPTWGPRLAGFRAGDRSRSISVWVAVAEPLSTGGFDTGWSAEARINVVIRQDPKPADSLEPPIFSHVAGPYPGPHRIGLSNPDSLALTYWSSDSALWNTWDGDSIVLYDTTTLWAFSRRRGFSDSRIVKAVFDVRPSALPETLKIPVAGIVKLPKGSLFKAYSCPSMNTDAQLVLDTGASLQLPSSCTFNVDDGATLELRAGSAIAMGSGSMIQVGNGSPGTIRIAGSVSRRVRLAPISASLPWTGIVLASMSGGSRIEGADISGVTGDGIKIFDAAADVVDSRFRNCSGAAIAFENSGRPANRGGVSNDSTSGVRWAVRTSPMALGWIPTNPGFEDSILVESGNKVVENNSWSRQNRPIIVEPALTVDEGATLDLEAGLELAMRPGSYINVGASTSGTLTVSGTESAPVTVRAHSSGQAWGLYPGSESGYGIGLGAYSSGSTIRHLVISGSSSNGILVNGSTPTIQSSRSDSNAIAGFSFTNGGKPDARSGDSAFVGNGAKGNMWSLSISPAGLALVETSPALLDSIRLRGNDLAGPCRWKGQPTPIVVSSSFAVEDGALLTISRGLHLLFNVGTYIDVAGGGSEGGLVVEGSASDPVRFDAHSPAGWGVYPGSTSGFCLRFGSTTSVADLSNLQLTGASANGILFTGTVPRVGKLTGVSAMLLPGSDSTLAALRLTSGATPDIGDFDGTVIRD